MDPRSRLRRLRHALYRRRSGVGLAICDQRVTAVIVRRGRVFATASVKCEAGDRLDQVIDAALAAVRVPFRGTVRHVAVALSVRAIHLKCFSGLPVARPTTLRQLIAADSARYFLADATSLWTSGVRVTSDGILAAAYSRDVIEDVRRGCARLRPKRLEFFPFATVLGAADDVAEVTYLDDRIHVVASYDQHGSLKSIKRAHKSERSTKPTTELFDADTLKSAVDVQESAAVGAVRMIGREPIALTVGSEKQHRYTMRPAIAAAAFIIALVTMLATPQLVTARRTRAMMVQMERRSKSRIAAERAQRDLARATRDLAELASFDRKARSMTLLIGHISRALPMGSAITAIQLDTAGGSLVVVAPKASDVLDALGKVSELANPALVGPVVPERSAPGASGSTGLALERITIRFLFGDL